MTLVVENQIQPAMPPLMTENEFLQLVNQASQDILKWPTLRYGQALFNALCTSKHAALAEWDTMYGGDSHHVMYNTQFSNVAIDHFMNNLVQS